MTSCDASFCQVAAAQREAAAGFRDVAAVLEQQRAAAEEAAAGARQDVRNLHLELVRQFHVQQVRDPQPGGSVYDSARRADMRQRRYLDRQLSRSSLAADCKVF